jgi:hypothetical protein
MAGVVTLGKHWLDGSYVTTKPDPGDLDIVVHLDGNEVEALAPTDVATLVPLVNGPATKSDWKCDSYPVVHYDRGHPMHSIGVQMNDHWLKFFGTDRSGNPKGMIEVAP